MTKKRKITAIVLCSILGVILIFVAVCGIRWAVHSKSPAEQYGDYAFDNGNAQFDLDLFPSLVIDEDATELKVMQIADPQIKFGSFPSRDRKTMDLLEWAIKSQDPDICVVTGDLTLSIFTYDAFKYFADFMEKWTCRGRLCTATTIRSSIAASRPYARCSVNTKTVCSPRGLRTFTATATTS